MKKFGLLFLVSLMPIIMINSQSLDDYRSKQSGNWNSTASWEVYDGTNWINAVSTPTNSNGVITIRNGHTIIIIEVVAYDQVIVEQGGQVTVASYTATTLVDGPGSDLIINGTWLNQGGTWTTTGTWTVSSMGTFIHNAISGISTPLNSASFDATSTFIYLGSSSLRPSISVSGRTYGNLRFESTSGSWLSDASVSGAGTLNVLGNFYVGSGVNYNTSQTGLMSFAGDFIIDGTLTNNTGTQSYNFTGVNKLIGGSTATLSFENVTIGSGASYQLERNISILTGFTLTVNGELNCAAANIVGSGNFTLAPGGTIGIGSPDGITSSGTTGNIQVSGTRTFSAGANFIYNGSSPQITGNGLPGPTTANSLTGSLNINNPMGVTLSQGRTITGVLILTSGNLITSNTNLLKIGSNGSVTGGSASSFVEGPMAKIIQSTSIFTFPIGKGSTYRTIGITPSSNSLTEFIAEYFDDPYSDILTFGEGIAKVSIIDYFIMNRFSGSANSTVTIEWGSNSGVGNLTDLRVARWSDTEWVDEGNTEITGDVTSGKITSNVVTSFSSFALGSSTIQPLPVELSSFSASVVGNVVKLNWKTETEVNNYGFEIERYALSAERQAWEKIGFVNGSGNSNSPKSYSFEDKNVTAGKYSYRLKQIDNDGQFEYSKVIEVDFGAPKKFELSQNYPNPFNPSTTINYSIPELSKVKLTLFNLLGEEVTTLVNEEKIVGNYSVEFNAASLPSGVYFYQLKAGEFMSVNKMLLLK